MRTVRKALSLLDLFTIRRPELGLTELAKKAGFDKATTRRLLIALFDFGIVEQEPATKKYRLGAGLLRLAHMREQMFPVTRIVQPVVDKLAAESGETAHASWALPNGLATIAITESRHVSRVGLEMGEIMPYHSTSSGLAFLAFSPQEKVREILAETLHAHTEETPTDPQAIAAQIDKTRIQGYATSAHTYEAGVVGVGAAILDSNGVACGAIAVASPTSRASKKELHARGVLVQSAANEISRAIGSPASLEPLASAPA